MRPWLSSGGVVKFGRRTSFLPKAAMLGLKCGCCWGNGEIWAGEGEWIELMIGIKVEAGRILICEEAKLGYKRD